MNLADKDPKAKRGSRTITRTELLASLEEQDALYDLYTKVTNRAIELFKSSPSSIFISSSDMIIFSDFDPWTKKYVYERLNSGLGMGERQPALRESCTKRMCDMST